MKTYVQDNLTTSNKKKWHRAPAWVRNAILLTMLACLAWPPLAGAAGVHALFDLDRPAGGPFPSDRFTVADPSQNTGRRVHLPLPDCQARPSDCGDLAVINTLDGFNLQPRLSIPFDGPIDVQTVTSETIFLIRLGSTLPGGDRGGRVVGINQVVWDTFTHTLHVESDELLDQHARYALVVTRGVLDASGEPVDASPTFRRFRQAVRGRYKQALLGALHAARRLGVRESEIAAASVFTTQSLTAILERIRDQIKVATPEPADFNLDPNGTPTVFPLEGVTGINWRRQTRDDPPDFTTISLDLALLRRIPGAVGQIAFGRYVSPDYEIHPGEFIPPVATRTGTPAVRGENEVFFNLFLPSREKPADGWPVAIFGHGNGSSNNLSFNVAASMAAHGIATIAINAVGHGFGPLSTLTVNQTGDPPVTFSAGGRGIDQNGDHIIGANEGLSSAPPRTILLLTDGIRQTTADLMQLVRVIEVGIDVDGDGFADLDRSRIYYFGQSLGGNYGTPFLAVEPSVLVGVVTVPGAPIIDNRRLSPSARSTLGAPLASRTPSLINAPGITSLDGVPAMPPYFNENMPLRNGLPLAVRLTDGTSHVIQSPVVNTVAGPMEIEALVENTEWVGQSGVSAAYAPHLRRNPLAGVPAKSVVYQFAKGDQSGPNPANTAILRAGDLADRTTFYRHDLAYAENPVLPKNPHAFMTSIDNPAFAAIARGAQEQIARFFASDGKEIIHPEPQRFFEVPIVLPLPEDLGFIP